MRNIFIQLVDDFKFFFINCFLDIKDCTEMFSFSHWKNSSHCPACGGFRVACDNRMLHLLLLLSKNDSKGRVGIV